MQFFSRLALGAFLGLAPVVAVSQTATQISVAQDDTTGSLVTLSTELPDAPIPHQQPPTVSPTVTQQSPSTSGPGQQPPGSTQIQSNSGQGNTTAPSPSPQAPASQSSSQQSQHEKAEQQVREQEKQRVEGVVPIFNVTYHHDAVPLTPGQKMNLSLHSAVDPFAFASAFVESGYHEAANDLSGFPWGAKGYFERTGAAYLDTFDGDILSTGVVPIIFRQDPRYFRMGPGYTIKHRVFYSLATNFVAKNDYNGKWGPNYGNILGNMAAGALSNLYYPNSNAGFGLTVSTTAIQIGEGAGGSIFNEFWPDISRKFLHKDPTHGLDTQAQTGGKTK
jgi:hypothetical protein